MVAGNIQGKTQTIPIAIFYAVENGDYSQAMIWVLIIFLISVGIMSLSNLWGKAINR